MFGLTRRRLRAAAGEQPGERGQQLQRAATACDVAGRFDLADHEAADEPGDDDPPRRPAREPRRLELAPVGGGLPLLCLERGLGLLHLVDQCAEAHVADRMERCGMHFMATCLCAHMLKACTPREG